MKFARTVFMLAGIIGILTVTPMLFLEERLATALPPPLTHPEHYYGFLCVVLSWQIAFLIIASDPYRFRVMMIPAILEKFLYGIAIILLFMQSRTPEIVLLSSLGDLVFGTLFVVAFVWCSRSRPA